MRRGGQGSLAALLLVATVMGVAGASLLVLIALGAVFAPLIAVSSASTPSAGSMISFTMKSLWPHIKGPVPLR